MDTRLAPGPSKVTVGARSLALWRIFWRYGAFVSAMLAEIPPGEGSMWRNGRIKLARVDVRLSRRLCTAQPMGGERAVGFVQNQSMGSWRAHRSGGNGARFPGAALASSECGKEKDPFAMKASGMGRPPAPAPV
jgi:hypothetical protein